MHPARRRMYVSLLTSAVNERMSRCSTFYAAADYKTDNFYCVIADSGSDNDDDNSVRGDDNWTTSTDIGKQSLGEHKETELFIYSNDCCCFHLNTCSDVTAATSEGVRSSY